MIILLRQGFSGTPARSGARRRPAALALGAALVGLTAASCAMAVNRLVLTVGQLASPTAAASGARVSLDLTRGPSMDVRIGHLQIRRAGVPALADLRLTCDSLATGPQDFACRAGRLAARAGTFGPVSAAISVDFAPGSRTWNFAGSDVPLAGGRVQIAGMLRPEGWNLTGHAAGIDLDQAAQVARPWVSVPAGYKVSGHADAQIALTNRPALTLKVAESPSIARRLAGGCVMRGGALTVRVATRLVTAPTALATTTSYSPACVGCTLESNSRGLTATGRATRSFRH